MRVRVSESPAFIYNENISIIINVISFIAYKMTADDYLAVCILVHNLETEIPCGQHICFLRNLSMGTVNSEQGPL